MEWLEQEAIATAPITCKPKLWKRYVDDVAEVVRRGAQQELTDHLNSIDPTGNIQFTYEEEKEGTLPFLDTLLVRKEDGTVKLLVYRKSTHTDQYLNFQSHHPLHQKLGVIRTLLDRCNTVTTEDQDKEQETQHVKRALTRCGYPQWAFNKVEQQKKRPKQKELSTKQQEKTKGMVTIPYIKGVTEPLERVFRKHGIATAVKPKTTLRSLLVHPKDKQEDLAKTDCVYRIPCQSCDQVYIGETGRTFGTRLEEHKKEANNIDATRYTRSQKKLALKEEKKSAVTDHIARNNCVIDWEGAKSSLLTRCRHRVNQDCLPTWCHRRVNQDWSSLLTRYRRHVNRDWSSLLTRYRRHVNQDWSSLLTRCRRHVNQDWSSLLTRYRRHVNQDWSSLLTRYRRHVNRDWSSLLTRYRRRVNQDWSSLLTRCRRHVNRDWSRLMNRSRPAPPSPVSIR
ncbi:uncharacterized protein LOC118413797 [Branchiostoma floridae]|uniref:Uncharacterized protein LOC118413797 n=1 Tax=Branchiostoma floridae TaxID=7739 RepID=A0A9J7L0Q0_BRAFL|nr:uncharacterized protein LOC118413797 [Branchiostoma floridae]